MITCTKTTGSFAEKEELSLLKRQNVFRSLSFGSTIKDMTQEQDTACSKDLYETEQQHVDGSLAFEPKGIIRMSTKQVYLVILAYDVSVI